MPAYKTSNGKWYVKYKNTTKRGFNTKREALQYEAKLKLGEKAIATQTFKVIAEDYLHYKESRVTEGTLVIKENIINNLIPKYFDTTKQIGKYSQMDCRKFYEALNASKYSTKYKNDILCEFKAVFAHAIQFFNLEKNPAKFLQKFSRTYADNKKLKEKEMHIWSVEDFNQFIEQVEGKRYKLFYTLLYFTGMRLGEARALTWSDFNGHSVDINKSITEKTKGNGFKVKEPKNSSSNREIELGENISALLMQYKNEEALIPGFSESWYIFGRVKPLPTTTLDRIKDNAIKKSGVIRITTHEFRHSHASYLIANGVNIVAVSRRLGHSDINITLKTYTHLLKKNELELVKVIDKSSQNLLNKQ